MGRNQRICAAGLAAIVWVGCSAVAVRGEGPSAGDTSLFDRVDADGDGALTGREVAAANHSLFERLLRRGDADGNGALSRSEFVAVLEPSRPAKQLEDKVPVSLPGANAVRYVLLTMDANRNARIEPGEVPDEMKTAFAAIVERLDKNGNGSLERQELNRGGPAMSAVASRYVARLGIDADVELAKLKKSQGAAYDRFERQPVPLQSLRDPQQARQTFAQLDDNGDGKIDAGEVPEPLRQPFSRLTRLGDGDGDGTLNEREFVAAIEQAAKFLERRQGEEMRRSGKPQRGAKSGD